MNLTTEAPTLTLEHGLDALLARIEAEMTQIDRDWEDEEPEEHASPRPSSDFLRRTLAS